MGRQGAPEKRQNPRARHRPTLASSLSLRHLLLALAAASCILSAWVGHTVGKQTALGVSQAASRAFAAPDAKKALATSKKLPVLEAALRRVGPAHALTAGFTALLVSLLFLYVFRKLFVERVEAASDHLRRASRAPDQVGRLKALRPGTFDTREVLRLHSAVNDGLADLDLRNRGRALVQATDARLQGADESGFLSLACSVLQSEGGGVGDARAYITRATEDERAYLIEAQGEAQGHAQGR